MRREEAHKGDDAAEDAHEHKEPHNADGFGDGARLSHLTSRPEGKFAEIRDRLIALSRT